MNKSLVLVMCDVLVLSAMSLSRGGFDEGDGNDSQAGLVDVTEEFQATSNALDVAQGKVSGLEDDVSRLKKELKEAAEKTLQIQQWVDEQEANCRAAISNANERAATLITQTQIEAEAEAKRRQQQLDELLAAEKERSRVAISNANERAAALIAQTQAEAEAEAKRRQQRLDELLAAEKERRRVAVSNAYHHANAVIAETKAEAEAKTNELQNRLNETRGELAKKQRELKETERKLEESERSVGRNIDVIEHMLCRVTVTTNEHKNEAPFYSPIIDIKGEAYVMVVGYDGKHLDKMKSILVGWAKGGEEPIRYPKPEAYYLVDGGRKLDIVLLKLQGGNMWTNRMTLGERTEALPSSYWCGKTSGKARFEQSVPVINLGTVKEIGRNFERGDMCVDVKKRSICCLYVSMTDDPFVFDDPNPKLRKWPFEEKKGKK